MKHKVRCDDCGGSGAIAVHVCRGDDVVCLKRCPEASPCEQCNATGFVELEDGAGSADTAKAKIEAAAEIIRPLPMPPAWVRCLLCGGTELREGGDVRREHECNAVRRGYVQVIGYEIGKTGHEQAQG